MEKVLQREKEALKETEEMERRLLFLIEQRERQLLPSLEAFELSFKPLLLQREEVEFFLESLSFSRALSLFLLEGDLSPSFICSSAKIFLSRLNSLLLSYQHPPLPLGNIIKIDHNNESLSFLDFFSGSFSRDYTSVGDPVRLFGSTGKRDLQFYNPSGMTVDHQNRIFVADRLNNRIQCFDSHGNFLFKFGSRGMEKGEFHHPKAIAFDPKNQRILVADTGNHRIQVFDLEGGFLFSFGYFAWIKPGFNKPSGIAINQGGDILVSNVANHHVYLFNEKGKLIGEIGSEGAGKGELMCPSGMGFFSNGDVVIADNGNRRLSIFNSQGQFVGFVGSGKLQWPRGLWVDNRDNILVVDNLIGISSLFVFSKKGELLKEIGQDTFKDALGVVVNQNGEILVSGVRKDGRHCIFVF